MSVLKQNYIVEKYNGEITEYNGDIHKLVERYKHNFRLMFGTSFNLRKLPKGDSRWGGERASYYYVRVGRTYPRPVYDCTRSWSWMKDTCYYDRAADCQFIIRDGFGRAVHPDVIYRAYIAELGALKTKFDDGMWSASLRWFKGAKAGAYGDRTNFPAKRHLKAWCQSKQKLDDEPEIRVGKSHKDLHYAIMSWDPLPRCVQKSWKTQSKARKQWAKNLK